MCMDNPALQKRFTPWLLQKDCVPKHFVLVNFTWWTPCHQQWTHPMKNTTRNSEKIKIGILWVGFSHCGCFAPFVKVSAYNNDIPTPICYRNHIGTNRTEWFVHKTLVSPIPCSRLQSSSHSTFFDRKFLQKDTKKQKEHCTDSIDKSFWEHIQNVSLIPKKPSTPT